ncbi:density-regulated protein [Anaeramoeba ignava]|uniref:Density-regulated protein n=1 Tax=Anaeramoeba ignava TaxID=1746090 RepID=A0A9Q0LH27_ANAIG|nr:density-regulated protein [Anaeramoeba ignava]
MTEALKVEYCPHCRLPPEYCQYGPCFSKCKVWLAEIHPEILESIKNIPKQTKKTEEKTEKKTKNTSNQETKQVENKKLIPNEEKEKEKGNTDGKIIISRSRRGGKKFITIIEGLSQFEVDLKKATKLFANKFSCGCNIEKDSDDTVCIQGDVHFSLPDVLLKEFKIPKTQIHLNEQITKAKKKSKKNKNNVPKHKQNRKKPTRKERLASNN